MEPMKDFLARVNDRRRTGEPPLFDDFNRLIRSAEAAGEMAQGLREHNRVDWNLSAEGYVDRLEGATNE